MKIKNVVLAVGLVAALPGVAFAQPPGGPPGQGILLQNRVTALEGLVQDLTAALAVEQSDRIAGDDAEAAARGAADTALSAAIVGEEAARIAGDMALQGTVDGVVQSGTIELAAVRAEQQAGDAALNGRVDVVTQGLANETAERQAADTALDARIDFEVQTGTATFTAELQTVRAEQQAGDAALNGRVDVVTQALTNETSERQGADAILQFQIEELDTGGESALEGFVTVNNDEMDGLAGPHIIFEGANVHVRSGSGATDDSGVLTGLGNLVVGYNEDASLPGEQPENRTGSHNLVVGSEHTYSSYGGFVAGLNNNVSGPSASVSGGGNNTASSQFS